MNTEFYQLTIDGINGQPISMTDFKDKALLIVNTASKCGLTSQYEGLESLYKEYKESGLVILGCPCDQFANQEPGTLDDIQFFCTDKYDITFPMSVKIKVNGADTHPLYKYLKKELKGFLNSNIKWNFTKFLIGPDGAPIKRFSPKTEPSKIAAYIKPLLSKSN
ncbi:MAG: glutathione peroxidase [Gammaproteobacteria bacterium]